MDFLRRGVLRAFPVLAMALATIPAIDTRADVVLADNLSATTADSSTVTGETWFAASFATDNSQYALTSVSLLLDRSSIGGQAVADIYSDGALEPGALLETLTPPGSISTSLSDVTFTSAGLRLAANTTYWVVLHAPTGSFDWAWTDDNTGSGAGFLTGWAESDDAGATWFYADASPFQMRVTANAVPEPSTIMLLGLGAAGFGLLWHRRDRPRAADVLPSQ